MPFTSTRPRRAPRTPRARRAGVLFQEFRTLSQRLGRDETVQREALGMSETEWQAWVTADAAAAGPADDALAGRIAWQNYLGLLMLSVAGQFGPEGDPAR